MQNTFFLILNGLAAAATTIAVGFAGFQFWSDRQVRAVQAQLTAVELLLPRYSWRKNVTGQSRMADTRGFFLGADQAARVAFDVEVFNEAGLSFRLFTPVYVCRDGLVELGGDTALRNFRLTFPDEQRDAFLNQEGARLQHGQQRLEYTISVNGDDAPDTVVFVELFFQNIAIDARIATPIKTVLAGYDVEDELDFLSTEERFLFTYLPEIDGVPDMNAMCGSDYLQTIEALREVLRSSEIWNYVPMLDPNHPFGIP